MLFRCHRSVTCVGAIQSHVRADDYSDERHQLRSHPLRPHSLYVHNHYVEKHHQKLHFVPVRDLKHVPDLPYLYLLARPPVMLLVLLQSVGEPDNLLGPHSLSWEHCRQDVHFYHVDENRVRPGVDPSPALKWPDPV